MPRYYFHICDGSAFIQDEEGVELPDDAAARQAAIVGLRDVMAAEVKGGGINLASFVEIENESRQHIETVSFTDAVSPGGPCDRPAALLRFVE
jgi:hypothetical protein